MANQAGVRKVSLGGCLTEQPVAGWRYECRIRNGKLGHALQGSWHRRTAGDREGHRRRIVRKGWTFIRLRFRQGWDRRVRDHRRLLRWPYGSQRRPGAGSSNESCRWPEGAFDQPVRYSVIEWRQQMAKPVENGARRACGRAELGKLEGARKVEQAQKSAPDKAEAVKQEASDGPSGRGLAR